MTDLIRTLTRIKAQCNRHENCTNCIFQTERKGVLDHEYGLVLSNCAIKRAFEYCFLRGRDYVLPPCDWDLEGLEKELDERSI